MGSRRPAAAVAALALVALVAVGAGGCAGAGSRVAPAALLSSIDAGTPPVIVDVRTRGEYEAGHVPGALHVPFYTLLVSRDRLPASPEQAPALPIVVYCQHGPRAGVAWAALRLAGYTNVRYLDGHMAGWSAAGLRQE
jgi:rhodanese-related sulfurtransferase